MSNDETFENYRLRREIEQMEQDFKKKAVVKRERVEKLIESDEATVEIERQVQVEMKEFLTDSTTAAEKMLAQISTKEVDSGQSQEELRSKLEDFLSEMQTGRGANVPDADPHPSPVEDDSDGGPMDLQSALDRIRKHGGGLGTGNSGRPTPPPPARQRSAPARGKILSEFDSTLNQVSDFLVRQIEESPDEEQNELPPLPDLRGAPSPADQYGAPPPAETHEGPPLEHKPFKITRGNLPPVSQSSDAPGFEPDQKFGDCTTEMNAIPAVETFQSGPPAQAGPGAPAGLTNMFEAEPGEDRDIDDDIAVEDPEGWNIPRAPTPPGAWVVEKQKEEGDGGLAGLAGDSYLMKKVFQEVRSLNRVYLVLLDKGVVTREEVEGKGSGPAVPAARSDDADDDDVVTVSDYVEDRYRPILTSDKDFSLAALVEDVHRLKTLREVLLKKGVISQKDLKKAGG